MDEIKFRKESYLMYKKTCLSLNIRPYPLLWWYGWNVLHGHSPTTIPACYGWNARRMYEVHKNIICNILEQRMRYRIAKLKEKKMREINEN